ncbi:MAG: radical SAM protein [Bacteroidetes bacterium]|nr:radical SAM protein [Bacteroidota bacterium]MBU1720003.1 radical SAM protein [Bacteroidota bacterium]
MATFLFPRVVYGPVQSRRFGISLGVNLLPSKNKYCNFDCIYCECGWTGNIDRTTPMPAFSDVSKALEAKLLEMKQEGKALDVITFAGNGEPTLNPEFPVILDETIRLCNIYFPDTKITVLTNATTLKNQNIFTALKRTDNCILKLDAGSDRLFQLINRPVEPISIDEVISGIQQFYNNVTIQTLFLRGELDGVMIDNTTDEEVSLWLSHIQKIKPRKVMIYPIDRETPARNVEKLDISELETIGKQVAALNVEVQIVG